MYDTFNGIMNIKKTHFTVGVGLFSTVATLLTFKILVAPPRV